MFLGNLGGQGINFLAVLLLIRSLEPAQFGVFSTALAVMMLASQFSDLGISTGFVRYASAYLRESPDKAEILFKITLYFKLAIALVVFSAGQLIAGFLAVTVFNLPEIEPLLRIAFLGSLGLTLWGFLQAILQAREWFAKYAWVNIFNNSLKLAGVVMLLAFQQLTIDRALWVMACVPFAGFLLDGLLVPKGFIRANVVTVESRQIFSKLFHFSKWVTLSTLCTMFLMRLDVLMLQSLADSQQVGVYSSANQLAMIFPLLTNALTISLLPKVSNYRSRKEILSYIKKVLSLIPFIVLFFGLCYLVADSLIGLLFSQKYVAAVPVFKVLLLSFSISVIFNPLSLVLYSLEMPSLFFLLNLLQLILALPMNYVMIPDFGAVGASFTSLAIRVLAMIFITIWLVKLFSKKEQGVFYAG